LSLIFILAGISKFADPQGNAAYMASKGMPEINLLLYSAAILELFAGLALLIGWKARWAATLLFLYLIPVSWIFHEFWNVAAPEQHLQKILFLKNIAIMGGLLYVAGAGAGRWSVDHCCHKS
jgi:putative oxidoreductase